MFKTKKLHTIYKEDMNYRYMQLELVLSGLDQDVRERQNPEILPVILNNIQQCPDSAIELHTIQDVRERQNPEILPVILNNIQQCPDSAIELVLPGLNKDDILVFVSAAGLQCPLTLEIVDECNTVDFINDLLKAQQDRYTNNVADINQLINLVVPGLENMKALQFKKCKHTFSAVPLIYNILTTSFKCPVCRSGSSVSVDTTETAFKPQHINIATWNILCGMAMITSIGSQKEQESEDFRISNIIYNQIQQEIIWTALFSIYNTENGLNHDFPHAVIGVRLRNIRDTATSSESDYTTLQTGPNFIYFIA
jgi:hypothetical protein